MTLDARIRIKRKVQQKRRRVRIHVYSIIPRWRIFPRREAIIPRLSFREKPAVYCAFLEESIFGLAALKINFSFPRSWETARNAGFKSCGSGRVTLLKWNAKESVMRHDNRAASANFRTKRMYGCLYRVRRIIKRTLWIANFFPRSVVSCSSSLSAADLVL